MNKYKKGLATIVILLFLGLALSPSIYADRDKVSLEPNTDLDIDLNRMEFKQLGLKLILNNLRLIFLLMFTPTVVSESYLRKVSDLCLDAFKSLDTSERDLLIDFIDIENIEVKAEISSLIEGDVDLDCGCDEEGSEYDRIWPFPAICTVLLIPFLFGYFIYISSSPFPVSIMRFIGYVICSQLAYIGFILDCYWDEQYPPFS